MAINIRALERAFDLKSYLLQHDPGAKVYGPNIAVTDPCCGKAEKLWVLTVDKSDGTKAGAYTCYYCDEGGRSTLNLIKRIEDCDSLKALEVLLTHQTGNRPTSDLRGLVMRTLDGVSQTEVWDDSAITPVALPRGFIPVTSRNTLPPYFAEQGISRKRAIYWGAGWCDTGYYANRLVIPVLLHGEQLFFVARYMQTKPPINPRTGDPFKKTVYPKGARPRRMLFNWDRAQHHDRIVITEGVLDAIAVGSHAVASFGTSFSQYQLELLLRTSATEIVIMWDQDAIDKAHALAARLVEYWSVRVVELPDARDPDDYSRADHERLIAASPLMDSGAAFRSAVAHRLA